MQQHKNAHNNETKPSVGLFPSFHSPVVRIRQNSEARILRAERCKLDAAASPQSILYVMQTVVALFYMLQLVLRSIFALYRATKHTKTKSGFGTFFSFASIMLLVTLNHNFCSILPVFKSQHMTRKVCKHDKAAAIKLPKCADNVFSLRINDSVFVVDEEVVE